jgi:two-component system cell cycle response regulator
MGDDDDDEFEATNIGDGAELRAALLKARSAKSRAYFIVLTGANAGEMLRVEADETVLGRSPSANLRINDDGVSRKHARVVQANDGVVIHDMGSANGTLVNGEMVVDPVTLKDGDKIQIGSTTILKFTYNDDLDESFQQKMYDAAQRDGMTKIFNKRYFLERIESELAFAKRHKTPCSLLMFDVDHFKKINDIHGHLAGDAVLIKLAALVGSAIRTEDVLARYGGEEFAVICRGLNVANAATFGERVRGLIEGAVFDFEGKMIPVTISVGAAAMGESQTVSEWISIADAALYEAKKSGRNRVVAK